MPKHQLYQSPTVGQHTRQQAKHRQAGIAAQTDSAMGHTNRFHLIDPAKDIPRPLHFRLFKSHNVNYVNFNKFEHTAIPLDLNDFSLLCWVVKHFAEILVELELLPGLDLFPDLDKGGSMTLIDNGLDGLPSGPQLIAKTEMPERWPLRLLR